MTIQLSPNAKTVLEKRFLRTDEKEKPIESAEDLFWRVAKNIAAADAFYGATNGEIKKTEKEFLQAMSQLEFLPCTPVLRNAGRIMQQLSACFVLPIRDNLDSIYETLKNAALIFRTGGAVGYSFSHLRPRGSQVKSTGGSASGPVSFMQLYDKSTAVINEGCMRYGGNMGVLRIDHPDIEEFTTAKSDGESLTNFNLSVAVTDEFMETLKRNGVYWLVDPHSGQKIKRVSTKRVFNLIAQSAWQSAEPGLFFIDEVNRRNPTPHIEAIEAVNLCGEQPLLNYETCILGSIVVANLFTRGKKINWQKLRKLVHLGVHFLDNTIDLNYFILPQMEEISKGNRKIGLGIKGFADLLVNLSIPYDSFQGRKIAEKLMKFVTTEAHQMSKKLGKGRGNFLNFIGSIWHQQGYSYMRNAALTTLAPTGTTALIASCSGGIEPFFALAYSRKHMKTLKGTDLVEVNPLFEKMAKERGFYSKRLMEKIAETGSCQGLEEVPEDVQKVFVTALDIKPEDHVKMQAAFQKYTHNAVSKTVNLPESATVEDVQKVFRLAYELKCKGITIYRNKSREKQVLNVGGEKET